MFHIRQASSRTNDDELVLSRQIQYPKARETFIAASLYTVYIQAIVAIAVPLLV